jgi:phage antirepressor YoqD-like protein
MNILTQVAPNDAQTMSSIEIAQLTQKIHNDVLYDIRNQLYTGLHGHQFDKGKILYPIIQGLIAIIDDHTKRTKEILLDRYHTDILISGYEVKYRAAIVKRWHELESKAIAPHFEIPQTLSEALLLAGKLAAEKEQALAKIEADRPKVDFANIVTEDSNTRCVRVWVKAMKHENNLTVGEQQVFKWLVDNRYIFKDSGGYLPYAKYESGGANYFTIVIDEINGKPRRQLKITGKGVVALTGKVVKAFSSARNGLVLLQGELA